jgi:hypothetical protein
MSIEVMKQALEALKKAKDDADNYLVTSQQDVRIMGHIVSLIEAELAKPEQEPVAWMVRDQVDGCRYPSALKNPAGSINGESQPLYTAPPQREWVGMTDDELKKIQFSTDTQVEYVTYDEGEYGTEIDIFPENFAKAIEAKLKEKNT